MNDGILSGLCDKHQKRARRFPWLYRVVKKGPDDDLNWLVVMTRPSLRGGIVVVCGGGNDRAENRRHPVSTTEIS